MHPRLDHRSPNNARASPNSGALSSLDAADPSKSSNTRKQKSSAEVDGDGGIDDLVRLVEKIVDGKLEGRHRTGIDDDELTAVRDYLLSLRVMNQSAQEEDATEDGEELHGLTPANKLNKVTVGSLDCLSCDRRPNPISRSSARLPNTSGISRCKNASSSCLPRPSSPRSTLSTRTAVLKYS